jgi:hypothetical protein
MRENVGGADRVARAVAGPALMLLGLTELDALEGDLLGIVAVVAGALIAETAITRVCPLNELAGFDTARRSLVIPKVAREWRAESAGALGATDY